jgi:hypothetical protein
MTGHDLMRWFVIFIIVLVWLYIWADCVLRNYFSHKRRHHLKLIKEIGKERPPWQQD